MSLDHRNEQFVAAMNQHQARLAAFIESLTADYQSAQDLLQDTNLVLWRKRDEFALGTNFWAWASKIAYHEVLHHRRSLSRSKLVFSEMLLDQLAAVSSERLEHHDDRCRLLRVCLTELPPRQQTLVEHRYNGKRSVRQLAAQEETTPNAISKLLQRARHALLRCIEQKMSQEQSP